MKARTSFEKSVVAANERLTDIAQKQIDWAVNKCVSHVAFRNAHDKCVCGDCSHSFIYDGKAIYSRIVLPEDYPDYYD